MKTKENKNELIEMTFDNTFDRIGDKNENIELVHEIRTPFNCCESGESTNTVGVNLE